VTKQTATEFLSERGFVQTSPTYFECLEDNTVFAVTDNWPTVLVYTFSETFDEDGELTLLETLVAE
jgi:hypothetical protein